MLAAVCVRSATIPIRQRSEMQYSSSSSAMGVQSDEVYDPYMGVEEDTRELMGSSMSMQYTDDNTDEKSTYDISYEYCDSNALPAEETSISSLDRDKFYKLCPGLHEHSDGTIAPLGQPRCGDNSNYSFMLQRPAKKPVGGDKLLIELSGGGACWDKLSCAFQGAFLTFPIWFDQLVGSSCGNMGDGMLLCDRKVGNTDFSEYTTILIPYCTQDIHSGDNPNSSYGVQHGINHNHVIAANQVQYVVIKTTTSNWYYCIIIIIILSALVSAAVAAAAFLEGVLFLYHVVPGAFVKQ